MIEPGGAVALFDEEHPDVPDNAWLAEYRTLLERYASDDPQRALRQSEGWVGHEALLLGSPFSRLERIGVIERRRVRAERLVDRALSQSSTSRARLGAEADRLAAEIAAYMRRVAHGWPRHRVRRIHRDRRPASHVPREGLPDQGDRAVTRRDGCARGIRGHPLARGGRICEIAANGTDR